MSPQLCQVRARIGRTRPRFTETQRNWPTSPKTTNAHSKFDQCLISTNSADSGATSANFDMSDKSSAKPTNAGRTHPCVARFRLSGGELGKVWADVSRRSDANSRCLIPEHLCRCCSEARERKSGHAGSLAAASAAKSGPSPVIPGPPPIGIQNKSRCIKAQNQRQLSRRAHRRQRVRRTDLPIRRRPAPRAHRRS